MKRVLFFLLLLLISGCRSSFHSQYSERTSQMVYATKDSIEAARIDLAKEYAEQSTRLIIPPKERIHIPPIYKPSKNKDKSSERVVIVPPDLGGQEIIVVGSAEYEELKNIKGVADQLTVDLKNLKIAKAQVDDELREEKERAQKIEKELKQANLKISDLRGSVWKLCCVVLTLLGLISVYFYLKLKGMLFFI